MSGSLLDPLASTVSKLLDIGTVEDVDNGVLSHRQEHLNALHKLGFAESVKAEEHDVAGSSSRQHLLTLEDIDAGKNGKIYEAKVLANRSSGFKELQEFKLVGDAPIGLIEIPGGLETGLGGGLGGGLRPTKPGGGD